MTVFRQAMDRLTSSFLPQANIAPGPRRQHFLYGDLKAFSDNPLRYIHGVSQYPAPIVRIQLVNQSAFLVNHPTIVHEALISKSDNFVKNKRVRAVLGRALGTGLVTSDGTLHKTQRRLLQPAFQNRRIKSYASSMVSKCQHMLVEWEQSTERMVSVDMNRLAMDIAVKTLFDAELSSEDYAIVRTISHLQQMTMVEFMRPVPTPLWWPNASNAEFKREKAALDVVIDRLIEDRRASSADRGDLLSALLQSADDGGMSKQQVSDELVTLFAAGHEPTANAMSWTWALLSEHPEVEKALHLELDTVLQGREPSIDDLAKLPYTEAVFKESLRLKPPIWLLNARQALSDMTLGGFDIPRGSQIFISPYTLHHDESLFPQANRFLPERWLHPSIKELPKLAFLPFGAGHRICIGNQFSMQEGVLLIATIAQRFSLKLQRPSELEDQVTTFLGPAGPMPMNIIQRN